MCSYNFCNLCTSVINTSRFRDCLHAVSVTISKKQAEIHMPCPISVVAQILLTSMTAAHLNEMELLQRDGFLRQWRYLGIRHQWQVPFGDDCASGV